MTYDQLVHLTGGLVAIVLWQWVTFTSETRRLKRLTGQRPTGRR